jgi:hypothetical protein
MQIAKIEGETITVGYYRDLFPDTSFSTNGPNADWFVENNCLGVTVFKPHDRQTQHLISCDPYIEDNQVFTVRVEDKPVEEAAPTEGSPESAEQA